MHQLHPYRTVWISLIHVGVWGALFALPYFIAIGHEHVMNGLMMRNWLVLGLYAISFYLNYFLLLDRFLFKREVGTFLTYNLILLGLIMSANTMLQGAFMPLDMGMRPPPMGGRMPSKWFFVVFEAIKFSVPVLAAIAVKTTLRWARMETERKEAENIRLQSDLQNLRYQLQPHFFFNSLNNIYSLVDVAPEDAKKTIHALGKLMRYLLYEAVTEKVHLNREIDFLGKYIALMKLRLADTITVAYDFPKDARNVEIAPLLFISLVENAFKHGISASLPSVLSFKMEIEEDGLTFTSVNTNFPKTTEDKSGSGVGLENLRRRLELLYPEKYVLKTEVKNGNFIAKLTILLN